ncbi:hypothetical protein [Chitinophaga sp. Cy-1792]|uniref:hypothetical protein n=1 Tax=Chitinophaga sp. Cy-1792 TaxID=2608339 RepID=UPI001422E6C0|nr:hypothetical protein [Chitinophaga sp. Cy-1792]NIG53308.1 hypothetical protein [Chitinophaga sp. Cy-1792]
MSQFPHIHLPLNAKITFTANPVNVLPLPDGEFLLNFASQPLITHLDSKLQIISERLLPIQSAKYVSTKMSASSDGKRIAIAGMNDIRIIDNDLNVLHTIEHEPWGYFLGSAVYFGADNKTIMYVIPVGDDEQDELQIIDAHTFELLASYPLNGKQEYAYTFHACPDKGRVMLEASAGQEECELTEISYNNGVITVRELPQCADHIFGNFSPSGKEFVTAPHYDGPLMVFDYPAVSAVAEQTQDAIFDGSADYPAEEPDSLNYSAFFIDDKKMLVYTVFGRLLLIDRASMQVEAEVMPEGIEFTAYDYNGNPTKSKEKIVDYSSNVINIMIVHNQLLLTTSDGELRSYNLPL